MGTWKERRDGRERGGTWDDHGPSCLDTPFKVSIAAP